MTTDIENTEDEASAINWRMSASLKNVLRGDADLVEVTSLERAVREWQALDTRHRDAAVLTIEHAIEIDGEWETSYVGEDIGAIVRHLPAASQG